MPAGQSDVKRTYFRQRPQRRALLRRRDRYEVWRPHAESTEVWLWELDALLDARRHPADYWAAVEEARRAFAEADEAWVEFPDGCRVADPPNV